ncbi:MAG: FIST C-terminal domain-containing protein [Planctomycetes bacterium]|nr:FIST C-terminal domain-containing protein [Planctomycetota bacterium]
MKTEQTKWTPEKGWQPAAPGTLGDAADLVFVFGATELLRTGALTEPLAALYPRAHVVGCTTAGEIEGTHVEDGTMVVTAIAFERTRVVARCIEVGSNGDSFARGAELAASLFPKDLAHVFVLSDGLIVNGSELAKGMSSALPAGVMVTGGLSGDGARFAETFVVWEGRPRRNAVVALGFYGDRIRVGHGCLGGWDTFGPERIVTRSRGNVLFELDGKSALELYKQYLGEHARGLPATGLLFPLSVRQSGSKESVVRTILSIDEAAQSMTFAGDVPEGSVARLMRANIDRLVDGAIGAAQSTCALSKDAHPELAILISCVGRKLVLKQRVEEEVEGVRDVLGEETCLAGFYSYGEISPSTPSVRCELHNQTMTITTFSEHE